MLLDLTIMYSNCSYEYIYQRIEDPKFIWTRYTTFVRADGMNMTDNPDFVLKRRVLIAPLFVSSQEEDCPLIQYKLSEVRFANDSAVDPEIWP